MQLRIGDKRTVAVMPDCHQARAHRLHNRPSARSREPRAAERRHWESHIPGKRVMRAEKGKAGKGPSAPPRVCIDKLGGSKSDARYGFVQRGREAVLLVERGNDDAEAL